MARHDWPGTGMIQVGEVTIYDQVEPCPYVPGNVARLPLRLQLDHSPERFDRLLAEGDRRMGHTLYRPRCDWCNLCTDIRIPVADFAPSRSQRRVWRRNADVVVVQQPPVADEAHLRLFNRHKLERGLGGRPLDLRAYAGWLVQTCTRTVEFAMYLGDRLVAVSIVDHGRTASSAVYCYHDPDHARRSLGIFAILHGIAWARARGFRYHYLGLHVPGNRHLEYKLRFLPHERLVGGRWHRVERT